jgi:hypothetical protein
VKQAAAALLFAFCLAAPLSAAQEVAVLPYAVETITADFPPESGDDYAKLIGVAASIDKEISVYSYRTMKQEIAKLGLDPQGTITREDLSLFCKSRYLSYAVAGRISHTTKGYESSSVLYSVDRDTVVGTVHASARTLPELAAIESGKLFLTMADRHEKERKQSHDLVIILDTSYSVSREWPDIKKGLEGLAVDLFDAWPGSQIHIIPFAENFSLNGLPKPCETVPAVRERLSSFTLKGGSNGNALTRAFDFALGNILWRSDSARSMLILTNAPLGTTSVENSASRAKNRRAPVSVIALGNIDFRDSTLYSRVAKAGGGSFTAVSYRQRATDNRGNDYYLLMQKGRLFETDTDTASWKDGLLQSSGSGSEVVQLPSYADEVPVVKSDFAVTPYSMTKYYTKKGSKSLLASGLLETNCSGIIAHVAESFAVRTSAVQNRPLARILLSQGKVSVWASVTDKRDLAFFSDRKELGFVFPLGVRLSVRADEPLGFTFNPDRYYTGFDWDDLPDSIRVSLSDIAAAPEKFGSKGLFSPPVWFVNVKVEEIEYKGKSGDIRGN